MLISDFIPPGITDLIGLRKSGIVKRSSGYTFLEPVGGRRHCNNKRRRLLWSGSLLANAVS